MTKVIVLNKNGYEPFFDFLKAFAILGVLAGHTFPYLKETGYYLWYGMQVPIFILIQTFHVFKSNCARFKLSQVILRIFVPYIIVQIPIYLYKAAYYPYNVLLHSMLGGGMGLALTFLGYTFKWQLF
jgi:hypothetical protein